MARKKQPEEAQSQDQATGGVEFDLDMAQLTVDQRKLIIKAKGFHKAESLDPMINAWELGRCVQQATVAATHGDGIMKKMADILAVSQSHLYKRMEMSTILTKEDIGELMSLRTPRDGCLTMTHIIGVLPLKTRESCMAMLRTACAEAWTSDALIHNVRKEVPASGRAGTTGPRATAPREFDDQAAQITDMLSRILGRYKQWTDDKEGLAGIVASTPLVKISPTWLPRMTKVRDLAAECRDMSDKLKEQLDEAIEAVGRKDTGDEDTDEKDTPIVLGKLGDADFFKDE